MSAARSITRSPPGKLTVTRRPVRRRNLRDDGVEERAQILARHRHIGRGRALAGDGVEHGELELVFVRVEVDEQVVDLVQHLLRAGIGAVDLVDDDDRLGLRNN